MTNPRRSAGPDGLKLRRQRLLHRVDQDPLRALDDRRCHKPDFCLQYFDLCDARALGCDHRALAEPRLVLAHAEVGVELAEKSGDVHVVHRGLGTLAHAYLAIEQPEKAWDVLADYRTRAERCCSACLADWLRRYGDYLVEIREGAQAFEVLNRSLSKTGDVETASLTRFVRGISHHYLTDRDAALADEFAVLESPALGAPRGYFLDAIAVIAVLLRGAESLHDQRVLEILLRFDERLLDVRDWTEVRTRLNWVLGQVYARLGNMRRAIDLLESVRRKLLKSGPIRHAVAAAIDLALILCRRELDRDGVRSAQRVVGPCLRRLQEDPAIEDPMLEANLVALTRILEDKPWSAFDALVAVRSSFVVPVPGIVSERVEILRCT